MRYEDKERPPEIEYSRGGGYVVTVGASLMPEAVKSRTGPTSPIAGMTKPALEGWGCVYNKPHAFKGFIDIMAPGCFDVTLKAGDKVGFWLAHDEDYEVASTEDRLEIQSDDRGLAFRLALEDDGIAEIVAERKAEAISPGYELIDWEMKTLDGIEYRHIKRAKLREISLVKRGAIEQTFARIVDAAKCAPLALQMKGHAFEVESSFARLMRALEDTKHD